MKKLNIITIYALFLFITSCTERIDIDLKDNYTRLVVEGSITTDTTAHSIRLTKTSSYYYNEAPPIVSGANVSISDGLQQFILTEIQPGMYTTDSNVYATPGKTYILNITLSEPIGIQKDFSASSYLPPISELDSVDLVFHSDWAKMGMWEVKCYVQEPPTTDFYRFLIYKNNKLLTDSLNEWFVTDDKFFNGNYTNGASIAYLNQASNSESLQVGDQVTVEVNNISKAYANFLWDAQAEARGSNPLFSGPPANVKGNISNGAVGFFAAYSITRKSKNTPEFK